MGGLIERRRGCAGREDGRRESGHSFSILLVMCILMVIGAALVPRLDISNEPRPEQGKTLTVSYSWKNASAKVVEQNVTSRIEALVSAVKGVEKVSSVSQFGSGRITVEMKPKANVSMAKFEIASILRQIRSKLPEDVSYPVVSGGEVGASADEVGEVKLILVYQINADMSQEQMRQIAEKKVRPFVERVEGVHHVDITGTTSQYMEISYDADNIAVYGIYNSDIVDAVKNYAGREDVVGEIKNYNGRVTIPLILSSKEQGRNFEQMPLKNVGGKIIYLNNLTSCTIREKQPDYYYRVNGMNTLYVNVYAEKDASVVRVADRVKDVIGRLDSSSKSSSFFAHNSSLAYDRADIQMKEFRTLVLRSYLTLVTLLLFVWLAGGRRWKYLSVITIALLANILLAVVAYWMLDIRLHPMSMAGITVSLGMIIDSTIVMVDHYSYYRNRKAFLGVFAAMLTTMCALIIVFWLPDFLQHDLRDFSVVVMINLGVAIVVALLFVPSLVDRHRFISRKAITVRSARTRYAIKLSDAYRQYVSASQHPFGRWALLAVFVCLFVWSLKQFAGCLDTNTYRPKREEMKLNIRAEMPVGGSVQELNDKVKEVEAFLSRFKEIKRFETLIRSRGASIVVEFSQDALASGFPYLLENRVIGKVITIGGADWATSGVSDRGFSNSLNLQYRADGIEIAGYDYGRLYRFAEDMCREMRTNNRVVDLAIVTPEHEVQEDEYFMEYNHRALAIDSVSPGDIHAAIQSLLSERNAGEIDGVAAGRRSGGLPEDGGGGDAKLPVVVCPSTVRSFDIWKLRNSYINVGGRTVRPSDFMSVSKREAKNIIPRNNQEYVLRVAFNVLGSYTYTDNYIKRMTEKYNSIFPVGFRCKNRTLGSYEDEGTQYWLVGLVAVIIFFISAILFESLVQALAITLIIPVSFIGLFLTYWLTGIPFGTGGFASMVLLAGLTVNAAIYIICQYNTMGRLSCGDKADTCCSGGVRRYRRQAVKQYVSAFNHKIKPIMLTIFSTVLGMIPFLIDGPDEQPFWYSLAVGTIGGLAMSIIPLVAFLPLALNICRRRSVGRKDATDMEGQVAVNC